MQYTLSTLSLSKQSLKLPAFNLAQICYLIICRLIFKTCSVCLCNFCGINSNKVVELVLAHSTGISEGWLGKISDDRPAIQLALDHAYVAPTAKGVEDGARLYGLVEGQLFTSYDMAASGKELQAHIWSSLERQVEN